MAARGSLVNAARAFVSALLLASAALWVTPTVAIAREVVVTEAQQGRVVRLGPGDRLRITLPSNGTTGFTWTVARMPPHLRLTADRMQAAPVPPGLAGAEGRQTLVFEAKRRGSGVLRLRYRQPWKGGMTDAPFDLRIESRR
jgi:inhibitor of cysteine peptidase